MAIIIIIINKTIMEQRFDWDQKSINDFIDIIFLFFLYVILYLYNIKHVWELNCWWINWKKNIVPYV